MTDVRNNDFVPQMAQSPRGVVGQSSYNPYIDYSRSISGCPVQRSLFASGRFRDITPEKSWTTVRSLVLFPECSPTGLVLREEVLIDPEVMAVIGGWPIPYVSGVPHGGVQVQ